jgi:hypothetical protein
MIFTNGLKALQTVRIAACQIKKKKAAAVYLEYDKMFG